MTGDGVYAVALGGVLLVVAVARSGWRVWRIWIGTSLVILGALLDFGATDKAYPGGPTIGMETQVEMFMAGAAAVLAGYVLLLWSALRRRVRHPDPKHP